ncbi:Reticulocyte-binding protein 2 homolog a [Durusdinium trenchii]|uniref:Reticulocyte-binding protein 2 homolog a n=1 Tax=Durusdinium trenchii TaxID=1381693 RepID=A0ABP0H5U1_9DINO
MTGARVAELRAALAELGRAREVQERRYESRVAALAEFDLIKVQTARRLRAKVSARSAAAQERSRSALRGIDAALERVRQVQPSGAGKDVRRAPVSKAQAALEKAQAKYKQQVELMYPAWQEQLERDNIVRLRQLERTELALERRRKLAQQAFEKEKAVRARLLDKEYDVEMQRERERQEQMQREKHRLHLERKAKERALQRLHERENLEQNAESLSPGSPEMAAPHLDAKDPLSAKLAAPTTPLPPLPPKPAEIIEGAAFELSYDWQPVPLSVNLPVRAEIKLERAPASGAGQRVARIPPSWKLVAEVRGTGDVVHVEVNQDDSVAQLAAKLRDQTDPYASLATVLLDERPIAPEKTVRQLGVGLFEGSVSLLLGLNDEAGNRRSPQQRSSPRSSGQQRTERVVPSWDRANKALESCFQVLERPSAASDLRASQYGELDDGANTPTAVQRVVNALWEPSSSGGASVLEGVSIECVCHTVKAIVRDRCVGLLPLSVLLPGGRLSGKANADAGTVSQVLDSFFSSCPDSRGEVWTRLVRHWQWLTRERALSREQVVEAFLLALLPPGEAERSPTAQHLRGVILSMTSNSVAPAQPSKPPTRTDSMLSYDALLGGSPKPARDGFRSPDEVLESHVEEEQEVSHVDDDDDDDLVTVDAGQLASPRPIGAQRRHVQRFLEHSDEEGDDSDDALDQDVAHANSGGPSSESPRKPRDRQMSNTMQAFLSTNRPSAAAQGREPDLLDEDDEDFDF